jgi:hypothetical protein
VKEIRLQPSKDDNHFDKNEVLRAEYRYDLLYGETVPFARLCHSNVAQPAAGPFFCEEGSERLIRYVFEVPQEGDLLGFVSRLRSPLRDKFPLPLSDVSLSLRVSSCFD